MSISEGKMQIFQSITDPHVGMLLRDGNVGVIPTDTVYGLVCGAGDQVAVERLFTVKPRTNQPGTVLAASIEQLVELGITRRYLTAVADYWPNPLSIIIPCEDNLAYLHMGLRSLAVRIPADEQLRALLEISGPLMTTSANQPGEPTAATIAQAADYFGDTVDFYVDAGELGERPPSTIIRIIDDAIEILRPGAITIDEQGRITS